MEMYGCFGGSKEKRMQKELEKLIIFSPPNPPKYTLTGLESPKHRGPQYTKCTFQSYHEPSFTYPWIQTECFQLKKTNDQKRIILLKVANISNKSPDKPIIIYSHGFKADLGNSYSFLLDLASIMRCDIISYDYSGYGLSEGTPGEETICSDIEHVLDFVVANLNKKIEELILFGSSLGSLPSLYIASQANFCSIKGLILLSPFTSAKGFILPNSEIYQSNANVFDNISYAKEVLCPVFIMHGADDTVIPCKHSQDLAKMLKFTFTWYPHQAGHSNIISLYRSKFYCKLKKFIVYLKENRNKNKKNALDIADQSILDNTILELDYKKKGKK